MLRRNSFLSGMIFCLAFSGLAVAQGFAGPGPGREGFGGPPPMERAFHDGRFGRWWNDPHMAQQLGLSDQQKHQMDDIFMQHRLKLIDLNANLEKQETLLHPMIEADQPDEGKILAQIDAVAQARAELEKANARMLFDLRKTLTADQWQKVKTLRAEHRSGEMRGERGNAGHGWRRPGSPDGPGAGGGAPPPGPQAPPDGQGPAPAGGAPPQ